MKTITKELRQVEIVSLIQYSRDSFSSRLLYSRLVFDQSDLMLAYPYLAYNSSQFAFLLVFKNLF